MEVKTRDRGSARFSQGEVRQGRGDGRNDGGSSPFGSFWQGVLSLAAFGLGLVSVPYEHGQRITAERHTPPRE